uniref:Uncharacterized protein n=1 Tax=Podoviridae sp. ctHkH8 TaxID=2825236 RepID=A0A8S5PI77_9CAUD|nr:MAG TPA: hypothetical protein [Podoviridae sp. ctHkH8]
MQHFQYLYFHLYYTINMLQLQQFCDIIKDRMEEWRNGK